MMSDSTAPEPQLDQLLARIALGDRAAFAGLYEAVKSTLFGVILRISRDRALAEDILQEVFVNIWRGAHRYDPQRSHPMAWLVSVARYRAIDHARMRELPFVDTRSSRPDGDGDFDLLDTIPSDLPGPAESHERADEARQLAHCMKALGAEQRQALSLAYFQGYSHTEVASHLAQPLGSVKSWVRRGLMALQRCMGASIISG